MSDADRRDFFISYAGPDRPWAAWITSLLRSNGYTVEFDAWDWAPGTDAVQQMNRALEQADRMLALWSTRYFDPTSWAGEESSAAMVNNHFAKGRLVPIRVEACTPPAIYKPLVVIELADRDERSASAELLARLSGDVGQLDPQPFPGRAPRVAASATALFPTKTPAIWNAPARNPGFVGRDTMLDALRERLAAGGMVALEALHGMGGVGKTQLAIEYVHRVAAEYDLVWWINSEQTALIPDQFAQLAVKLGQWEEISGPAAVAAVLEYLRARERWLLVFDDATDPESLRSFQPSGRGSVLVTSRSPGWGVLGGKLEVDAFAREESLALLRRRLPDIDDDIAEALAVEMEDLPLALAQAAGFMETRGTPPAIYLDLWRTKREQLLAEGVVPDHALLATTWAVSLADLEESEPAALQLLQLASFMGPEEIPLQLLRQGRSALPERLATAVEEPLVLDAVLGSLWQRALIRRSDDGFYVHALIQAAVRSSLTAEERVAILATTRAALMVAAPMDIYYEPSGWPMWRALLPHVLLVLEEPFEEGTEAHVMSWLADRAGVYLQMRGELDRAVLLLERATDLETRGGDQEEALSSKVNLADALSENDQSSRAVELLREVVQAYEAMPEPDLAELGSILVNFGGTLELADEFEEALEVTERGLKLLRDAFGPRNAEISRALNCRAVILMHRGQFERAREDLEQALAIEEEVQGPRELIVAVRLSNLASVDRRTGDLDRAAALARRAYDIRLEVLGRDHPTVQLTADFLDDLRRQQG